MISANDISDEQKERIREWAGEGATLGEIQKRASEELEITMTYLDARMLIADLGISLREEEKKKSGESTGPEAGGVPVDAAKDSPSTILDGETEASPEGEAVSGPGSVKVSLSEITPPGMIASGNVTFSDGETAQWYFDQMGRLGLNPARPDYRPSEADVDAFQNELQKIAQRQGL